jgi:Mitochondrial biogenesis AIM24
MTYIEYEPDIKVDIAAQEVVSLTENEYDIVDPMRSGFVWYQPPLSVTDEHVTGGQQWQISGHDMQVLTMSVPANDVIVTEVGSFMFGSPGIVTEVELTLFGRNGCTQGCGRICGGESCVKVLISNKSPSSGYIGLTPTFPAKIVPIKVCFFTLFSGFTIFAQTFNVLVISIYCCNNFNIFDLIQLVWYTY